MLSRSFTALSHTPLPPIQVMRTILTMFTAFHNADATSFSSVVDPGTRFVRTSYDESGHPDHQEFPYSYFVDVLKRSKKGIFDETFDEPLVQIRDNMAHVWCKYRFAVSGEEKHRGYKSVQLRKGPGEKWIVISVCDTIDRDSSGAEEEHAASEE